MIEAAESIERFLIGRQRSDLDTDEMLAFALVRAVEIIGERHPLTRHALGPRPP